MSGGVAVFDYNNDGLLDIFLVNGAALRDPMPAGGRPDKSDERFWNRLYRNNGSGTFTDVTAEAGVRGTGYGMGVAAADYDNDGNTDLYVTNVNGNILYHNNGDGTFVDVTGQGRSSRRRLVGGCPVHRLRPRRTPGPDCRKVPSMGL